jgi:ATP-dependent protease ClpP protease subunit
MSKRLIFGGIAFAILVTILFVTGGSEAKLFWRKNEVVFDRVDNSFAITTAFNEGLQEDFTRKIMTTKAKTMYLYINSPGGSVYSLNRMIEVMKGSNKTFICVARFAASAAFTLLQHCDVRMMTKGGMLMSHGASVFYNGKLEDMKSYVKMVDEIMEDLERAVAKRMKKTYKEYKKLISKDFFMSRVGAVKHNAIDRVTYKVSCSKELVNKKLVKNMLVCGFFGCVNKKYKVSACPLIETKERIKEKE